MHPPLGCHSSQPACTEWGLVCHAGLIVVGPFNSEEHSAPVLDGSFLECGHM